MQRYLEILPFGFRFVFSFLRELKNLSSPFFFCPLRSHGSVIPLSLGLPCAFFGGPPRGVEGRGLASPSVGIEMMMGFGRFSSVFLAPPALVGERARAGGAFF